MGAKLDAVNCPACRGKRKPHTCGMSDSVVVLPGDVRLVPHERGHLRVVV